MSTRVRLDDPNGWIVYLAPVKPTRLVIFVHGFYGAADETWNFFPDGALTRPWWRQSDLLFVNYDSTRDEIGGVAYELRDRIPDFYPEILTDHPRLGTFRPDDFGDYEELYLVGHSLGGVIVRYALLECAIEWRNQLALNAHVPRPRLLDAHTFYFSPASAGFRPGGKLALLKETRVWSLVELQLRRSTAYTDLEQGSRLLERLQDGTETTFKEDRAALRSLSPRVVWARPDNVVRAESYRSDMSSASSKASHRSVCKPHLKNEGPWRFIETGKASRDDRRQSYLSIKGLRV